MAAAGAGAGGRPGVSAGRRAAGEAFFEAEAERIARLCHAMAERFARGGRLLALGATPAARSDARHVAVEFVHPVIVGKRALPALGLAPEGGAPRTQLESVAEPGDIAIGFDADLDPETAAALGRARELGCLTLGFGGGAAEWEFEPPGDDRFIRQELVETLYHVLWELVHVFFDHRGLLSGREAGAVHDTGASSFLYPFLSESEDDLDAVVDDVRRSVLAKSAEIAELREQTLSENRDGLVAAASALRAVFEAGGRVLACGNGGSATDAMDLAADLRRPPDQPMPATSSASPAGVRGAGWPNRPAIDLTEDAAILTAIANDVGVEQVFSRQVIALGRAGDALVTLSTSGSSGNLISALAEARGRGLVTLAMVGYDGGRIASEGLADHVVVSRSQHIPRIQEAQASASHVLRELIELVGATAGDG